MNPSTDCRALRRRALPWLLALAAMPGLAQERTEWGEIRKSMSALLNEGWRVENMTYGQILRRETVGGTVPGDSPSVAAVPDGLEYNFLLSRQGKWAVCVLLNPKVGDTTSRCRSLN